MNFNNIILMLLIELVTFYMIRNHIINKVKKKWSILIWHPTLAGILKKSLLTMHLLYAIYGILVFCPISDTKPNPIPLYALYQLLMHGKIEALTLCLYNTVLMFPVGLWLGEVFKPARSSFLYKWTAILTGIIGIYLEYSQYVLEKGRPATDDLICILIACCAGVFFRDAYEKIKQYYKLLDQLIKNEKNKRLRAKEKAEKAKAKEEERVARDAELEKIEQMALEEEEEKKRLERKEKRQKRKEEAAPYIEKVTGSVIYQKLSNLAAVSVFFLLTFVQWFAELVADKKPEEADYFEEDDLEEEIEGEPGEPRWKKLKRENQKQAKNPMMKKSRRMKREAMRKLRAQDDVDEDLEEEQKERTSHKDDWDEDDFPDDF